MGIERHTAPNGSGGAMLARSWGDRHGHIAVLLMLTALLTALVVPQIGVVSERGTGSDQRMSVVVRALSADVQRAEQTVAQLGGRVGVQLPIIDGFGAEIPGLAVDELRRTAGIVSVTPDSELQPRADAYGPASDAGSMYNVTKMTGAQDYWGAGYTGQGVDVALIDSGIVPVDGLTTPGKIVNGPDLSFESQADNLAYLDTFGHGTHMAGIIAGRADEATPGGYVGDTTDFLGMAPDARILSLKVADAHGATDVSQVIAAIDWVVQHKNDGDLNIRVLNLSYGTDGTQDYRADPLDYAVEQAWKAGIFVVTAAGNNGPTTLSTGDLSNPARDPVVLTVGAANTHGTTTLADDTVAGFSSVGSWSRRVDLVAPGSHIVSLRAPGSMVDQTYGSSGSVSDTLFRGSGTSQAAAVVSGAAALVIQQYPDIRPDQLKAILMNAADPLAGESPLSQGQGELDLTNTLRLTWLPKGLTHYRSNGNGSLEGSRGTVHLSMNGVQLSGEQDIFGNPFDAAAMADLEAQRASWSGGTWNGSQWTGSGWSAKSWSAKSWSGASWGATSWSGASWGAKSWSGASWGATSWSDATWDGASWGAASWSGGRWLSDSWSGGEWASATWADASWS